MARTNTTTNMLGRLVECTEGSARLAASMANDTDRSPLPIVLLHRSQPCEVVGRCREDGRTWFDVATPDGVATVMAEQVRLSPDPEVALRLAQVAASTDPNAPHPITGLYPSEDGDARSVAQIGLDFSGPDRDRAFFTGLTKEDLAEWINVNSHDGFDKRPRKSALVDRVLEIKRTADGNAKGGVA